ncbi:phosphoglycolate phosphatase 2-like [Argonauta hians]
MLSNLNRTFFFTRTKIASSSLFFGQGSPLNSPSFRAKHTKTSPCRQIDGSSVEKMIDKYDTMLLDCDGVVWGADHVSRFDKVNEALQKLRKYRKRLLFVTNNSLHSTNTLYDKFVRFGFEINHDEIFCITTASAFYLKSVLELRNSVYVIGSKAMGIELQNSSIRHFGIGPEPDVTSRSIDDLLKMHFRDDVGAVLVGFDEHLCYSKLYKAASYLKNPDCHFIVTSDVEMGTTIGRNRYRPSVGAVVGAVASAAHYRKYTVIGKPSSFLYKLIKLKFPKLKLEKTLIIGDSLKADIKFAKNIGADSALVLSGATDLRTLQNASDRDKPTYYFDSLAVLADYL